jgi:hypothetical protein
LATSRASPSRSLTPTEIRIIPLPIGRCSAEFRSVSKQHPPLFRAGS